MWQQYVIMLQQMYLCSPYDKHYIPQHIYLFVKTKDYIRSFLVLTNVKQ